MKTAIDFYARGKQKEADADEYNRSRIFSRDRFICPECGEPVHLTGSKYSNHFAHFKKSDVSAECDRRVDGDPADSVYERIGLPIYMRKNAAGDFTLNMGFKALPIALMEKATNDSVFVKIDGKSTYRVNQQRFSCDGTALIPLEYIPMSGMKYRISYEPANKTYAMSQHWSDYADGFSSEGALFSVSELGGKKIRHGDSVTTDVDYYWVRREQQLPSSLPGVEMRKCGRLLLKGTTLNVFYGKFISDITDAEYKNLTRFLRENLRNHLLEKQPEFVPLWPPVIKTEEGYLVGEGIQNLYGHIVSGNDNPKIYAYQGIQKTPEELRAEKKLISVRLQNQYTLLNIDRKYVSNGALIVKIGREITSYDSEIFKLIGDETLKIKGVHLHQDIKKIHLKSGLITDFILVRFSGQLEMLSGIGEYIFEELQNGDQIFVIQNRNLVGYISVEVEKIAEELSIKGQDVDLYKAIHKLTGTAKEVIIPYRLRLRLYEIRDKMILSQKEIDSMLKDNSMPLPLVKVLGEMFND